MIARPSAVEPAPSPGATTSPSPASPASVLSRVARATRSPEARRSAITWSGTVPAIIAATLESMRVSAMWTTPTPSVSRSRPAVAAPTSSRRVTRRLFPRTEQDRREEHARHEEAAARGEERRQRLDDDLDAEVRRAPDEVDDEQRRPHVPDRSRHAGANVARRIPVRTSPLPRATPAGPSELLLASNSAPDDSCTGVESGLASPRSTGLRCGGFEWESLGVTVTGGIFMRRNGLFALALVGALAVAVLLGRSSPPAHAAHCAIVPVVRGAMVIDQGLASYANSPLIRGHDTPGQGRRQPASDPAELRRRHRCGVPDRRNADRDDGRHDADHDPGAADPGPGEPVSADRALQRHAAGQLSRRPDLPRAGRGARRLPRSRAATARRSRRASRTSRSRARPRPRSPGTARSPRRAT